MILGACNPVLADRALEVEAPDPAVMVTFTGNPALEPVATEARAQLSAALRRWRVVHRD